LKSYLAHIRYDTNQSPIIQTVEEHCRKTAEYAAEALKPASLSASGFLVGLIHDLGKYSSQFQDYLIQSSKGQPVKRGSVNHTFASVRFLLTQYHHQNGESPNDIAAEILALAAGSHHGWFDCIDDNQKNGFLHRMTKDDIEFDASIEKYFQFCTDPNELNKHFQAAADEMFPVLKRICEMTEVGDNEDSDRYDQETSFYAGLLARLLLSGVIEGDRRDTAEFMHGAQFPKTCDGAELEKLWRDALIRVETKLNQFSQNSEINQARRAISDQCKAAAQWPGGIFRLNVPTGGGKTLSALRYALAHAEKYQKQRIIFTSPLLSILEQNAAVIREYLQDDSIVLEHHSNLVETEDTLQCLDKRELLTENWDSPVIITTLVQLLNTLFSGKTTAIRRFHALCGSIIVIDEVQTVPSKMLTLFSLAVNFLAEICGTTVILCSATQPCMEKISHPLHTPIRDLVPYHTAIWAPFKRTDIIDDGEKSAQQIADFALQQLSQKDSVLIVCNKKDEAETIFHELETSNVSIFLLSAAMCPAHRRDTLSALRNSLSQKNRKTICVSTQVIEAGVDISFACVIRLAAGMDSVIQAAGRCNRNGEDRQPAPVYLVRYRNENLANLQDIQAGKEASLDLLAEFSLHPEKYHTLDSNESIEYYYRALYKRAAHQQFDYVIPKQSYTLFSLLARNGRIPDKEPYLFYFRQAFRRAGALFTVFEEDTQDVLVPYGEGSELIAELCGERVKYDLAYLKELLKKAKPYTISLYSYQLKRLDQEGGLIPLAGESAIALNGHYHEKTGFSINTELNYLEV
jgi:CRISPR-associated endonuclease/helicase Cas3